MKCFNCVKTNWHGFKTHFNFRIPSFNSIDNIKKKLRTASQSIQKPEENSRLRDKFSIPLNNDKSNFVENSKDWSTNDAYKLMRQITKTASR